MFDSDLSLNFNFRSNLRKYEWKSLTQASLSLIVKLKFMLKFEPTSEKFELNSKKLHFESQTFQV
jgi:hypothetical protein